MKVHLIGIAGSGMGGLARMLRDAGHEVRGSDAALYPPMSTQLREAEIPVFEGFSPDNLDWKPDVVVVGNVCGREHVEVVAAQQRGVRLESFPSLLAEALLPGRRSLVVAGTHGKTTTTGLLAHLLTAAGLDPSYLVGGVPRNFASGAHLGRGPHIVIEGDEYDTAFFDKRSKFLHYRPSRAILTSVEFDHADIFADLDAVRATFVAFVATLPEDGELIVCRDEPEAMGVAAGARCNVLTYGVLARGEEDVRGADWCAVMLGKPGARRSRFEIFEHGRSLGVFSTELLGRHNVANVLGAFVLARRIGVDVDVLRAAIRGFRGVRRRQELIGIAQGVRVVEDFAHHPSAVRLTLAAVRRRYPDQALHVCFEPRSASSRRRVFQEGYAHAFEAATRVYVGPLFRPEKIPVDQRLDPAALAAEIAGQGVPAHAYEDTDTLLRDLIGAAGSGDTVLVLSSGSFDDLPRRLLLGLGDPVMFAETADHPAIDALLHRYDLPRVQRGDGVDSLVVRTPEGIVGCVSLQSIEGSGVLFGLAVAPERRGQGLGWVLGDCILRHAQTLDVERVYIITNTAADFFAAKLGFRPIRHEDVEPAVRSGPNFQAAADTAVYMVLELPPDPAA